MPLLLLIFLSILTKLPANRSAGNPEADVQIVNTTELLSLIGTKDDTVRLFNFWATWCKPCVAELPYFEELNKLKKNEKFRLYLVSLDFRENYKKRLIPFMKKKNIESTVLLFDGGDPNVWIDKIHPDWNGSIPASLVTYKNQNCFEENSFDSVNSLNNFINNCKTLIKS
jgi:thiol-disulfide isomerase/thioredoxin